MGPIKKSGGREYTFFLEDLFEPLSIVGVFEPKASVQQASIVEPFIGFKVIGFGRVMMFVIGKRKSSGCAEPRDDGIDGGWFTIAGDIEMFIIADAHHMIENPGAV